MVKFSLHFRIDRLDAVIGGSSRDRWLGRHVHLLAGADLLGVAYFTARSPLRVVANRTRTLLNLVFNEKLSELTVFRGAAREDL